MEYLSAMGIGDHYEYSCQCDDEFERNEWGDNDVALIDANRFDHRPELPWLGQGAAILRPKPI
jgi:hypothetical protein